MRGKAYVINLRRDAYCVRENPELHPAFGYAVRLTQRGAIYQRGPTARKAWEWAAAKLSKSV